MIPTTRKNEFLFLLIALVGLASGLIWIRTATVKDTYQYVKKVREAKVLEDEIQALKIRWGQSVSPTSLQKIAEKLEMGPPQRKQIVTYLQKEQKP